MDVIEMGPLAQAALSRCPRYDVVMTFSRGEVWRTCAGEIIWVDSEPDAFSPIGVNVGPALRPARTGWRAGPTFLDAALDRAIERFLGTLDPQHLVGLGPGLTPAGDDFLGGFVMVHPLSIDTNDTNEISRARLAMHMRGEGTRAEVRFIRALTRGEDTSFAERALEKLGATSGRDFIRGARAALELTR
ncbi:MAG TPA: DUF2877 domain-containing protein [Thermoanaerobaculia bacterium]|nr:DUF2877 domain-containing protein [Thermoanaerobaculia bacterium]